jgi:PmbA protein
LFEGGSSEKTIINSKGLNKSFKTNSGLGYLSLIVEDSGDIKTSGEIKISNDFNDYSSETAKEFAYKVVDEAISMLGAKPVKSGNYKIILRNTAAATLLQTFLGIFSAENVQKGLSLLKDKVGTNIASSKISIVDDPFMANSLNSSPFDDEGVAAYKKDIINEGRLTNLLYNLKTAKKDNVKSTGNARKGYKSPVGISAYNMYIQNGEKSYEDMLKNMGEGLIITELQGLHSGANAISGDFSLSARGYYVQNGEISFPVEQITVSGNFYNLLKDVDELASDLKFSFPGSAYVGSPSLLIKNLKVAGE